MGLGLLWGLAAPSWCYSAIPEGEAWQHTPTALPLVRQDTPPCLSYLGLIQSLFYPTKSMALQGTAGAPGCAAALCTSLQIPSCQTGRKEARQGKRIHCSPSSSRTWLTLSPALQKCLESKLEAEQGICAGSSQT